MNPEDRRLYAKGQLTTDQALDRFAGREEKKLQRLYNDWLLLNDLDFTNPRMDKATTVKKGTPDFHFWRGEKHGFVEFKSQYGRLSQEQKDFIARQCERGTAVLVTGSFDEACEFTRKTLGLEPVNHERTYRPEC